MPLKELMALALEVTDPATTCDGLIYHSSLRTVIRVKSQDLRSEGFVEKISSLESSAGRTIAEVAGRPASIALLSLSTHSCAAVVVMDHFYDKYNPPLGRDEVLSRYTIRKGRRKKMPMF